MKKRRFAVVGEVESSHSGSQTGYQVWYVIDRSLATPPRGPYEKREEARVVARSENGIAASPSQIKAINDLIDGGK